MRFANIEIGVDIRNGNLFRITALPGYEGAFRGVMVGAPIADVLSKVPGVEYDVADDVLIVRTTPGISIDIDLEDPKPEEIAAATVTAISVFDPDVLD